MSNIPTGPDDTRSVFTVVNESSHNLADVIPIAKGLELSLEEVDSRLDFLVSEYVDATINSGLDLESEQVRDLMLGVIADWVIEGVCELPFVFDAFNRVIGDFDAIESLAYNRKDNYESYNFALIHEVIYQKVRLFVGLMIKLNQRHQAGVEIDEVVIDDLRKNILALYLMGYVDKRCLKYRRAVERTLRTTVDF